MQIKEESMRIIWEKYRIEALLIILSLIIALIAVIIFFLNQDLIKNEPLLEPVKSETNYLENVYVDLSGAVERADVYEITSGARLKDVLIQAGGLAVDADRQFFSRNFNLASKLKDQEKIYIPTIEETQSGLIQINQLTLPNDETTFDTSEKISINNASLEQLDSLPGIGKITAQKIIQSRPYQALSELINNKVIGKSVYEKIINSIQL